MNDKVLRFEKLMEDARNCKKCEKILIKRKGQLQDCGLVNFIADATIDGRIPTIWTDWINRLDAAIAIIGQDWGAVSDIEETLKRYRGKVAMAPVGIEPSEVWRQTVREPDSKTNEKLIEFLAASAKQENLQLPEDFVDDIFATNAVLCVRQGKQVRGSANFSASVSIHNCHEFLRRQLEIVEPLVVVTLGEWPLRAVAQIAGFSFDRSLSAMIDKAHNTFGYIMTQRDYVVVPVVHPAAPYPNEDNLWDYGFIWQALLDRLAISETELVKMCFPGEKIPYEL